MTLAGLTEVIPAPTPPKDFAVRGDKQVQVLLVLGPEQEIAYCLEENRIAFSRNTSSCCF